MPLVLSWLLARPALLGLLALAAVAGWQWLRAEVYQSQRDGARAEAALTKADLARQTSAVAAWQARASVQAAAVAAAQRAAAEGRQHHEVELRRLLEIPAPTSCEGAVGWATERAGELAEGWRRAE